ncbi:MAG: trimeric autotransporter adhesin [Frankiaceae bacterium]|nr:trimeric autotransporter adhesin [Frankiaceae bacterium]
MAVLLPLCLATGMVAMPAASADTAPPDAGTPATVSVDALPTTQVNGVVWQQVTVGNVVYATGKFTSARPPGAAAGTGETPRANLLAYDIRTGQLISSFNHSLNGQGMAITASPDGSTVYVGGDFTTVDGASRPHIAAFSTATGAVKPFTSPVNGQVRALSATNGGVYAGGNFTAVGTAARSRLAAFDAAGRLLGWAPRADSLVRALVLTPSASKVVVGGQFSTLNGATALGLGAVNTSTGAVVPWSTNTTIQDYGDKAGIVSLRADAGLVYGTGFKFNGTGNFEGTFAADPETGNLVWMEDCHGDTYDTFASSQVVYTVGHAHNCHSIGAYPQANPQAWHRAQAFTRAKTGTVGHNDQFGYTDWYGKPRPSLLDWFPTINTGTFTGQSQGAWSVTGNAQYIALGGEFTQINRANQQGLTRFAVRAAAPNKVGPVYLPGLTPSFATGPSAVTVRWQSTYDNDNEALTYRLVRDGNVAVPVSTRTVRSTFWNQPYQGYTDTGVTPGTHTYRIYAVDPLGNSTPGPTTSVTVSGTGTYRPAVRADGPMVQWPLDEAAGPSAADISGGNRPGTYSGGVAYRTASPVNAPDGVGVTFNGSNGNLRTASAAAAPAAYSTELWFRTTTAAGGRLVGFGNAATGLSSLYDRQVYMLNSGQLTFGVYSSGFNTATSPARYNDGRWHQLVATQGSAGMVLYVDGSPVATNARTTNQAITGYWRVGGDNLAAWPSRPTSNYFAGSVDEVAISTKALSAAQVRSHYDASPGH